MSIYVKDPSELLDYAIDWNDGWLATSPAETISTSNWTVATGITKEDESNTTTTATVWLSGGTHGQEYLATNTITTSDGRTGERSIKILVRNR
jgi:hypothetical protein